MKRIIALFMIIILPVICFYACDVEKPPEKITDADMVYIDAVYNELDAWDVSTYNSGQDWNIDKIAFFDFDGSNNICFYTLYPVTDVYGRGFFVSSQGMEQMDFSIYDHDERIRHQGWLARTRVEGIDWNSSASNEQKYETLKQAFLFFKENNIYKQK